MTLESATRGISFAATSPTHRAEMIEIVPGIGHSAMVTPSTQSGSTLPNFYNLMSPLLSAEEDKFIHQIVNSINNM